MSRTVKFFGGHMAVDMVCKMQISENTAEFKTEYKGIEYYFCGLGCKDRFDKDPERFLDHAPVDWIKE